MKSWKEDILNKYTEDEGYFNEDDIMSSSEVKELLKKGCPLVARDYHGDLVGVVSNITDNFSEVMKYDDFGAWDSDSSEEFTECDFILIYSPQGYGGYSGMNKPSKVSYVYSVDGAYVSKNDNIAMITLYDKKLFLSQFD